MNNTDITVIVKDKKYGLVKRRPLILDEEITWSSVSSSSAITQVVVVTDAHDMYHWDLSTPVTPNGGNITILFESNGLLTIADHPIDKVYLVNEDGDRIYG